MGRNQDRRETITAWIAWGLVAAWTGGIFYLSSKSGDDLSPFFLPVPHFDKICHFLVFAVGAVFMVTAVRGSWDFPPLKAIAISVLALSLYGAADEWHQLFTAGRSGADVFDWLADSAGAIVGAFSGISVSAKLYARTLATRSRCACPDASPGT